MNLIAPELVIVHPMTSMSGYITYINYVAGSNKGQTKQGDIFNNPFALGDMNADGTPKEFDSAYTSMAVVESVTAGTEFKPAWIPVIHTFKNEEDGEMYELRVLDENGDFVEYANLEDGVYTPAQDGKIAYKYNNVVIPQSDLPIINAKMEAIPLVAKARRIAIYYSQIAAYQAKTDYGFDLGDQLAEQAVGRLQYEIDTEVCQLLIDNATVAEELTWSKTLPVGVSKAEHYEGFSEVVEIAKQKIYDVTKRFVPNYMLIASNVLPVLTFIKGFQAAPVVNVNGPYFAGTLNGVKVFVTPNIATGKFVFGVNGDDLMTSAAVYAPYMAIVPTQLLQYADGGTSEGFSTLYDLKILNKNLLVAGQITA